MADSPDPSQPRKPNQSNSNSYLKYSGLAIQLLATIFIAGWLGFQLDQKLKSEQPWFMITFGFLGFAGMMYQVYKSINK